MEKRTTKKMQRERRYTLPKVYASFVEDISLSQASLSFISPLIISRVLAIG